MPQRMMVRKVAAVGAALAALTVALVAGMGSGASATQGQPVIAGQSNEATAWTSIINTSTNSFDGYEGLQVSTDYSGGVGVQGWGGYKGNGLCGLVGTGSTNDCAIEWPGDGVHGQGQVNGVSGLTNSGAASGVYGQNSGNGYGVAGRSTGGIGVLGEALGAADGVDGLADNSCCSAVYGLNNGTGNGVAGRADTGTGVLAASTGGIGLKVDGKAQFSRAGTATVTGTSTTPKSSIRVNGVALTSKSLVLTTPQKNVAGVWIQAAVPNVAGSYLTIYLNKAVTVSYPVAWFVVEKP